MNEFHESPTDPMAEILALLHRAQVEGATDEEVPIITGYIYKIEKGEISTTEALRIIRERIASRNDYH